VTVADADELQLLRVGGTNGDDHAAALAKLREQSGRHVESGCGYEDGIEGGVGRETEGAIAGEDADVGVAERGENAAGVVRESGVAFDGENLSGKFGEQGGDVSGTGADFENRVLGGELERFEHEGDDVGLRDGLIVADGKRMVVVGFSTVGCGNEFVTRNTKHGVEDARVGDAAGAELGVDHLAAGCGGVGHEKSASGFGLQASGFGSRASDSLAAAKVPSRT